MNCFWDEINEHRLPYKALCNHSPTFHVGQGEEQKPYNLKCIIEIEIRNAMSRYCHQNVIAEDPGDQHSTQPSQDQRGFSPDNQPEKKCVKCYGGPKEE